MRARTLYIKVLGKAIRDGTRRWSLINYMYMQSYSVSSPTRRASQIHVSMHVFLWLSWQLHRFTDDHSKLEVIATRVEWLEVGPAHVTCVLTGSVPIIWMQTYPCPRSTPVTNTWHRTRAPLSTKSLNESQTQKSVRSRKIRCQFLIK